MDGDMEGAVVYTYGGLYEVMKCAAVKHSVFLEEMREDDDYRDWNATLE